jgi:uncharacterized hydrophobic protein (TIGR00271 family)
MTFLDKFKLAEEKEDFQFISNNIHIGIDFKGTNLWILIFAVFIASLGLNINSTAVIIGAMLVSPLMGPIIGLGFGMAVNDLQILKKSFSTYLFSSAVGLASSTIFFILSPINDAHSEILSRISPTIYDVLIALFGGLAGILAISSKLKGNVIPGVAIATALIPPLCTAGYGLATFQFSFFFGALYLFLINTVFIALATLVTSRILKFPFKHIPEKKDEIKAKRIVWAVVLITIAPSLYFGYDIVQQNKFQQNAENFIALEANFPNDYLLKKSIDLKDQSITLTYGGEIITEDQITKLKGKLKYYNLNNSTLTIQQGFAYLKENSDDEETSQLNLALAEREKNIQQLQLKIDSLNAQTKLSRQIYKELKSQYPEIQSSIFEPAYKNTDTLQVKVWIALIKSSEKIDSIDQAKIKNWLKVRMNIKEINVNFE